MKGICKYTQKWGSLKSAFRVDERVADIKGRCSRRIWWTLNLTLFFETQKKMLRIGLLHIGAHGNPSRPCRFSGRYKQWGHQLQSAMTLPTPPAVSITAAAGFSSLVWKLSEACFVTDSRGFGATSAESYCSNSWNPYAALPVCSRTVDQNQGSTLLVSAPKRSKWGFNLSVLPHYFPVCSSSTDFSLEVKMTPEPSLTVAFLIPNGQLCVVSVFFLSILSTFLSSSSICCYHMGFFP